MSEPLAASRPGLNGRLGKLHLAGSGSDADGNAEGFNGFAVDVESGWHGEDVAERKKGVKRNFLRGQE